MNLFDTIQANAHLTIANTMGYPATWTPANGGFSDDFNSDFMNAGCFSATVLFKKPTQKDDIADEDYDAISAKVEIFCGDFPGLFESIRSGTTETIVVNGISYDAYRAEKKYDGKTIIISVK